MPNRSFKLQILLGIFIAHHTTGTAPQTSLSTTPTDEVTIPVLLWNGFNNPAEEFDPTNVTSEGIFPPRYLVGMLGSKIFLRGSNFTGHYFTFDLGNSKEAILSHPDCLGCGVYNMSNATGDDLCPSIVPTCDDIVNVSFCWPSHEDQHIPSYSFHDLPHDTCPEGTKDSGNLTLSHNRIVRTCTQCFGDKSHSRFYTPAESSSFVFLNHMTREVILPQVFPSNFKFGALIRTVPLTDRLWSNIGMGPHSEFLNQANVSSFMLRLRPGGGEDNVIILHPNPSTYANAAVVPYHIESHKRHHKIPYFRIGDLKAACNDTVAFFMDSGNAGISVNDTLLLSNLATITGGEWLPEEDPESDELRLFVPDSWTPRTAPDIFIALAAAENGDAAEVRLPGGSWVLHPYVSDDGNETVVEGYRRTLFSTYHKNVLGLPVLSAPDVDFVFHDDEKVIYVVGVEEDVNTNEVISLEQF